MATSLYPVDELKFAKNHEHSVLPRLVPQFRPETEEHLHKAAKDLADYAEKYREKAELKHDQPEWTRQNDAHTRAMTLFLIKNPNIQQALCAVLKANKIDFSSLTPKQQTHLVTKVIAQVENLSKQANEVCQMQLQMRNQTINRDIAKNNPNDFNNLYFAILSGIIMNQNLLFNMEMNRENIQHQKIEDNENEAWVILEHKMEDDEENQQTQLLEDEDEDEQIQEDVENQSSISAPQPEPGVAHEMEEELFIHELVSEGEKQFGGATEALDDLMELGHMLSMAGMGG